MKAKRKPLRSHCLAIAEISKPLTSENNGWTAEQGPTSSLAISTSPSSQAHFQVALTYEHPKSWQQLSQQSATLDSKLGKCTCLDSFPHHLTHDLT